jgi:hypothetical protein
MMKRKEIREKLDKLIERVGDPEAGECMVVFFNKDVAYSLHLSHSGQAEVLTKLYPGRITWLEDDWDSIDLSSITDLYEAEEIVSMSGLEKAMNK